MKRRYKPHPLVAHPAKQATGKWRTGVWAEAREVRSCLVPVDTQEGVAKDLTEWMGKKVSRQNVEMWELAALTKLLGGLREMGVLNDVPAPSALPPQSPATKSAPKPTVLRDMRARVRPQKTKTSVP